MNKASSPFKPLCRLKHWGCTAWTGLGLLIHHLGHTALAFFTSPWSKQLLVKQGDGEHHLPKCVCTLWAWARRLRACSKCAEWLGNQVTGAGSWRQWQKLEGMTLFFVWNSIFPTLIKLRCSSLTIQVLSALYRRKCKMTDYLTSSFWVQIVFKAGKNITSCKTWVGVIAGLTASKMKNLFLNSRQM